MNKAFTIVELLVSIGIIALIIGILVPVVSRVRQEGQAARCLANLRQLGQLVSVYASSNNDSYPPAYWDSMCWDFGSVNNNWVPGFIWSRSGSGVKLQQCPSFDGSSDWTTDPYTGYNYNVSAIGHGQFETVVEPLTTAQVTHPSTCALFGDGQYSAGANKFMRSPMPIGDADFWSRTAGTQGYRHRGRTNVAYCDGHAGSISDCYRSGMDGQSSPGTGFLSADNSAYLAN